MVQPHAVHGDLIAHRNASLLDIVKITFGLHFTHIHRKVRRGHLLFHHPLQTAIPTGGMKNEQILRVVVHGSEKWDAMNVVPMKVGNENVGEQRAAIRFMQQLVPQRAQACATIENIKRVAQTYLDTRGVAAIPQVLGLRSGRRSAHTPELDAHSPPKIGR